MLSKSPMGPGRSTCAAEKPARSPRSIVFARSLSPFLLRIYQHFSLGFSIEKCELLMPSQPFLKWITTQDQHIFTDKIMLTTYHSRLHGMPKKEVRHLAQELLQWHWSFSVGVFICQGPKFASAIQPSQIETHENLKEQGWYLNLIACSNISNN